MTGDENTQETELTLSRKFTQQPANTYIENGTAYPILAARLKMLNSGEVETSLVTPYNPINGRNIMPSVLSSGTGIELGTESANVLGGLSPGSLALEAFAINMVSNNLTAVFENVRTPVIYRHALCTTSAATAVWDPAAGKKFRIMGYAIIPAAGMAAAGIQLITFLDSAAAITIAHQVYLPAAANVVNQPAIVVNFPGNGYLSVVTDNVLNVTLTSACTAGAISVSVWGTEE